MPPINPSRFGVPALGLPTVVVKHNNEWYQEHPYARSCEACASCNRGQKCAEPKDETVRISSRVFSISGLKSSKGPVSARRLLYQDEKSELIYSGTYVQQKALKFRCPSKTGNQGACTSRNFESASALRAHLKISLTSPMGSA